MHGEWQRSRSASMSTPIWVAEFFRQLVVDEFDERSNVEQIDLGVAIDVSRCRVLTRKHGFNKSVDILQIDGIVTIQVAECKTCRDRYHRDTVLVLVEIETGDVDRSSFGRHQVEIGKWVADHIGNRIRRGWALIRTVLACGQIAA